ncbi:MAG: ABC transporter permease subunit [bacterium]|nr:ABC transporter permease subunit [bacterium]
MNMFYAFFKLESKRFFCKRNMVIFLLFWMFCLYFVQVGVQQYKSVLESKENFLQSERLNVKQFVTYYQYGTFGFRLLFLPSPFSSLFYNSSIISELTSFIDSGVRLRIYNTFLGRQLFAVKSGGFKDFSGILFLFGSLFSLYLGYESLFHKEYLKFLGSFLDHHLVYTAIIISRILLISLLLIFIIGSAQLVLILNGMALSQTEYFHLAIFGLVIILTQVFFFGAGTAVSSIKSKSSGITMIFIIWFVFVFVIPGAVQAIVAQKSHAISSDYKLEQEKLKKLMAFEKMAIKREGIFHKSKRKSPAVRKLIEKYLEDHFKLIQELNKKVENEIRLNIDRFLRLSIYFPSTFYLSVNNEISSKGYDGFLEFYAYNQKIKEEFMRYFLDKKFFNDLAGEKGVKSFIKGEENVFRSRGRLPGNFGMGVMFIIIYTGILFGISFYRYGKSLFQALDPGVAASSAYDLLEIPISSGEYNFVKIYDNKIFPRFFILLSGKDHRFKGKIDINGQPVAAGRREDFLYVCRVDHIPGEIGVKALFYFFKAAAGSGDRMVSEYVFRQVKKKFRDDGLLGKRFNAMENHEKGRVLLTLATLLLTRNRICLLHNFETGMPPHFNKYMEDVTNLLKNEGASILHFSSDAFFIPGNADRYSTIMNKNGEFLYKEIGM